MQKEMHLYSCTDCIATFAVEATSDVCNAAHDHSDIVCPLCKQADGIEEAGYGHFTVTIPPEQEAS